MDAGDTYLLIILLILLLFSSFFSSTETALMSVNKIKLRSLADGGNKRAALALDITENHTAKMLSAILIGNNIVNVSASSLATTLAYSFGGYMVSIATLILTVAILVFGEITPKNYATINAEKLTLRYIIESDEKEMIYNVFDLGDAKAKDIMVPRVHVTFADVNSTFDELIDIFREDKFTRLPVYEETQDNVVGIINMKDLLLYDHDTPFNIRDFLRKPHFTYEFKDISELLVEMRDSTFNIAIVLDEYGEMAGLITLEDILEEIVGEIHDEYDENEDELIKEISDHEYIIEGSMSLDDVNDHLHTELNSEDYDSLGGLIIEHLDRLPQMGDEVVTEDGIRLVVEKLDKNRVEMVHVYLPERTDTEEMDGETSDASENDKHSHE